MKIVFAGIIGRYPLGGVAWCSLMYLMGLRDLGHDVVYVEDMAEPNYDPVRNGLASQPDYATAFIDRCLRPHGFGDRWLYVDYNGGEHGPLAGRWQAECRDADLFLVLSGGVWRWRDEFAAIPHSAYIDSDPGFTQLRLNSELDRRRTYFEGFGRLFTFGRNIGTPASPVPVAPFAWEPTWQPVVLDAWRTDAPPARQAFTTVMTWKFRSFKEIGGDKAQEMLRVLDLPSLTTAELELAVNGPREFLEEHGWRTVDALSVSLTLDDYRSYICDSLAEFSAAKETYVAANTGWFSDRTQCYLASGRPAVVQDTGFAAHLPTGLGLHAYRTIEEARDAIESVRGDYGRNAIAAAEIARSEFASDVVLPALLERTVARRPHVTDSGAMQAATESLAVTPPAPGVG